MQKTKNTFQGLYCVKKDLNVNNSPSQGKIASIIAMYERWIHILKHITAVSILLWLGDLFASKSNSVECTEKFRKTKKRTHVTSAQQGLLLNKQFKPQISVNAQKHALSFEFPKLTNKR
eukprot:TRINITY_DN16214_c0_g1_i1.p1 TRINITY_DN16214_c0_g1~~TRINITY_DN16214_c0_g1_i1.p1  ORF type:complete len:119 (+),score=3.11 TRINITY_DN16214_c0_g1_i1:270-626(+)